MQSVTRAVKVVKVLILLFAFAGSLAHARLVDLLKEFERVNGDVKNAKDQIKLAVLTKDSILAKMGWYLSSGGYLNNNNLEPASVPTDMRGNYWNYNINLSKPFIWGGEFQLTNNLTSTKLKAATDPTYLFEQGINFSQDLGKNFLGRENYKSLAIAEQQVGVEKVTESLVKENKLLEFYNAYLQISLERSLLNLEKNALERAKKRSELIRGWVKDGLKRKVDWQQSVMTELEKSERVEMANLRIKGALDTLSKLLHRRVRATEVNTLKRNRLPFPRKRDAVSDNKNLLLMSKRIHQIKLSLEKAGLSFTPSLKAYVNYSTNQYDSELGTSVTKGGLWNSDNSVTAGINLTWPLGFKSENIEKAKLKIQLRGLDRQQKDLTKNLKVDHYFLRQQLKRLNENLKSSSKRLVLSKDILKEYTKLYDLGQMDLDQVIRAEEMRIGTETSIVNYVAQKERYLANLHYVNGHLRKVLFK